MRTVSRFGGKAPPDGLAKLMLALLLSLRGTALIYQGEELGPAAGCSSRRDSSGIRSAISIIPTPMAATAAARRCRGMPTHPNWASPPARHGCRWARPTAPLAVSRQIADAASHARLHAPLPGGPQGQPGAALGEIEFLDAPEPVLAFVRSHEGEQRALRLQYGRREVAFADVRLAAGVTLGIGCGAAALDGARLIARALRAEFIRL